MGVEENSTSQEAVSLRAKMRRRYDSWSRYTTWPMFVLSLVFVGLSGLVIAKPKGFPYEYSAHIITIVMVLWVLFIVDFVVRMVLSQHPPRFIKTHLFELASLVIPYLRPFLLLRYIWKLKFFSRFGAQGIRIRAAVSIILFAFFFVYTISTAVWVIERVNPKANIVNWGDAMWWGFTTITTVGYGDYTPVTNGGRSLAVLLMIGGIFVVGVTSATVISSLSDQISNYVEKRAETMDPEPNSKKPHSNLVISALSLGAAGDPVPESVQSTPTVTTETTPEADPTENNSDSPSDSSAPTTTD